MGRQVRRFASFLVLACAAVAASAPCAESALPTVDELMGQLLYPDTATRQVALRQIVQRGEGTAVPGLIDILVFDLFLDSSVTNALNRLTGQAFGHDWRLWVEWLAEREDVRPQRDYAEWKGALLQRIDPAFGEFLYAGVKHRARLEEIQWGGVRKDGIPALTNPRHVPAGAATYLTPDELIAEGTGERWRIEEEALVSAPGGRRLARLAGHLSYWFGWFAFHPDTRVYGR